MVKKDLIKEIAKSIGKSQREVEVFVDAYAEVVKNGAKEDGVCPVPGLGKVSKKDTKARSGKIKDKTWSTPAKTILKFNPSPLLTDFLEK